MTYRPICAETAITIEHDGNAYDGTYSVRRGLITVSYGTRQVVTRLDSRSAEPLARMILHEIVSGNPEKY